ncbi:M20/M25/M40 family metallo-hydrolase [Puia dinghuensis]|uniref:Vacuolar membrane protease n=1 Tax=Puia dinghuensis TaxID=1792502 RepID=A0A8J2XT25_9BACT|nr:M20/M25/M40 family metallo-hydrolase [Puia dinghuensis]GGB00448.1 hypothetical protein GCM10011511_24650 [Puia dinghuensis]
MRFKSGIGFLLAAILFAWLCIHLDTTPARVNSSPAAGSFSAARAMDHLRQIAKAPHSTGTPANAAVRAYILNTCATWGLDTSIQHATAVISTRNGGVVAGNVYNIVVRLKGASGSKAVLIAAHYDSQPNALGAGDDGSGCVAMLETIRALKTGHPLKNDIIFLFTDDEEDGLLGAYAFVRENPLLKEVGMVLNFDARGSSGVNVLSETNKDNGWVIDGYAHCAHPNASSLNYEVYKRLPNNTDYTPLKGAGLAGLNMAFIDGFVHYHSMTDRVDNIDPNTIQEEGDNMLSLTRYFGDLDIRDTKAPDLSFFNLIGNWFIRYPASLNIIFLILTNILLLACLIKGGFTRLVKARGLLAGFLAFPLVLLLLYFAGNYALLGIRIVSPLYNDYYSNTYHPGYYYFALTALGFAIFTFIYRWLLQRWNMASLLAGMLIILVIVLDGLYFIMPTAIYFLCFPLLIFQAGGYFIFFAKSTPASRQPASSTIAHRRPGSTKEAAISWLLLIPAILFLAPICYMFFIAFDLQPASAAVPVLIALLLGFSVPLLSIIFRESRWMVPGTAAILCIISLAAGFLHRGFTPAEPMKTNLNYFVDADQGKAHWLSFEEKADHWNKQFFPNGRLLPMSTIIPGGHGEILENEAPVEPAAAAVLTIRKDTIENGRRMLSLHCDAPQGASSIRIVLGEHNPVEEIIVDGRQPFYEATQPRNATRDFDWHWLEYRGVGAEGIDLTLQLDPQKKCDLSVISRSLGIPALQGSNGYPPDIIPGPGNYSNTILVVKKFSF